MLHKFLPRYQLPPIHGGAIVSLNSLIKITLTSHLTDRNCIQRMRTDVY